MSCCRRHVPALQLGCRLAHVLRRILPISLYLLQKDGRCLAGHDLFLKRVGQAYSTFIEEVREPWGVFEVCVGTVSQGVTSAWSTQNAAMNAQTLRQPRPCFIWCVRHQYVHRAKNIVKPWGMPVPWLLCVLQVEVSCKHRCLEDLTSTTRFVTWSLHTKSHKALKNMMGKLQLADPTRTAGAGERCRA